MPDPTPVSDKTYETLTDRQQAHVDELAKEQVDGLNRTAEEIVESAADGEDFKPYNTIYLSEFRKTYSDIIDERADAILNDHATVERGNVRVTGDIDISDPEAYPKPQAIKERPVKGEDPPARISVDLTLETAYGVLSAPGVPEDYRREVFEAVVDL